MDLFAPGQSGVLPSQVLRRAIAAGVIRSRQPIAEESIQPASLDLRLGEVAYRLRCSFLPGGETVAQKLAGYSMGRVPLEDGNILERNRPYLIPLQEEVHLPPDVGARANPRSSTGRLDIFTRVITDRGDRFDEVPPGYRGRLYLEVVSRSFTVRVQTGLSLNQLRLLAGRTRYSDDEVRGLHASAGGLLFRDEAVVPAERLLLADGLFLSVDLSGDDRGRVGFQAKKNSRLLDLCLVGTHDPDDFWVPVRRERGKRVVLEPEEFYLLISEERVRIPPPCASEMSAYDASSGELRTHYAGFFDPGFGYDDEAGLQGTAAVLEVRAHDVPFVIEHGQRICKLTFEKMMEPPLILYGSRIGSSYQHQQLTLSKHFRVAGAGRPPSQGSLLEEPETP